MKRIRFILFGLMSSALAGGAEQSSAINLTSNYYAKVVSYTNNNLSSLPEITNCNQGRLPYLVKPSSLKNISCGIYKKSGQAYIYVSGSGLTQTTVVPSMPANNPREKAMTFLKINVALTEMHQRLGWKPLEKCFTAAKVCQIERNGEKFKVYFESIEGIRLYYDGVAVHNWPK